MGRYLLNRLVMTVLVVLVVMTFLSLLVHLVPGDPVQIVLGPQATASQIAVVRAEMGLDDPIYVQVWDFVVGAVQGDLGRDFLSRDPVSELIVEVLPHTVALAVVSLALASVTGIPLGVLAARKQGSAIDRMVGLVSVGFVSLPSYVVSLYLLVIFAVELRLLPASGASSFSDPVDYARNLILPATALALSWIGYVSRIVRACMLEVLGSNYIRTARAFGVRERVIFRKGALKNAIIPTLAVLSSGMANLLGGAVIIEIIFSRPGLGRLTVEAISERNFPIVQGTVLVIALIYVTINLLADISYRWVDPRIRVEDRAQAV